MKTIKVAAIAFALIVSGGKLFAQTQEIKKDKVETVAASENATNDDPANDFLKKYVAYLEDKKPLAKKPAPVANTPNTPPVSREQVVKAQERLQNNTNNLSPAFANLPGYSQAQIAAPVLLSQYLGAKQDLQIYNSGPAPAARVIPPTLNERIAAAKQALAIKESLDKKNTDNQKTEEK